MTDIGSQEQPPKGEAAEAIVAEAPAPEPWTPRRVSEWNSYYDLYVAAFVVLLVFLGSANKIQGVNTGIWSLLDAGRQVANAGAPVVSDSTSIAGEGRRWVNLPWLYELSHYAIFSTAAGFVLPAEANASPGTSPEAAAAILKKAEEDRALARPRAEQYGAGALIAVDALIRGLTALVLLQLRRKGPGLWWSALCVTMALGVTLGPAPFELISLAAGGEVTRSIQGMLGLQIGGVGAPASVVAPETWGLLFLVVELLLLHQAIHLGKAGRLYGLVPLFALWANFDESFAIGLVVLGASVVGLLLDSKRDRSRPVVKGKAKADEVTFAGPRPTPRAALIVLGLSFASTFLNPSHALGVLAAFGVLLRSVGFDVGPPTLRPTFLFGSSFAPVGSGFENLARSLRMYYAVLVGLGLASFVLNRKDFSFSRFLAFVASSILWALAFHYVKLPFAVVLAATLALNGQEWYQRTLGTEGRLGAGWTLWSTGGRLLTLALLFAVIVRGVTGWGGEVGDAQFGFGFNPDDFPFESAEALRDLPIEGNVLNTTLAQGDAIAWKAQSKRRAFIDSRNHLYPDSVRVELRTLREALKVDDIAKWRPVLDRYKISAVMIQLIGDKGDTAPNTYIKLMNSPDHWRPFHDDGAVVIFGRVDDSAPKADVAYFKAHALDAGEIVFRRPTPSPPWERPPTATWDPIDSIFQNRLLNRPQPHVDAATRWLRPVTTPPGRPFLPDPAGCLLAIREARTALSHKPDDSNAFQILADAYQLLIAQESAMIAGMPPAPGRSADDIKKILQSPPQSRILANRSRQLLSVLNFRIGTLPPSRTADDLAVKAQLNYTLAQLYLQNGALDLARERLSLVAADARVSGLSDEFLTNLTKQLLELNQRVEQVQSAMNEFAITRKAGPLDKANFARSNGAPGLAIHELEEVNDSGANIPMARPTLVDLYCEVGLPDKAFDVIFNLNVDDPSLSTGLGTASYRQGLVYFLLGNYGDTAKLWGDNSIRPLRLQRSLQAPMATQMLLGGDPVASTRMFLELPNKVSQQAEWEFELGLVALEGGLPPDLVAEHFETALQLEPNLTVRPVIAYYLEKLGKAVPPPRSAAPKPATPAPSTPPAADKSELPDNVFAPEPPKP